MSKWGVNEKKLAAREREETKKVLQKQAETKAKEQAEWEIKDKAEMKAIERKQKMEEKKQTEFEKKVENKKLYEEDMARYQSNKAQSTAKMTKAEIQKRQQQLLLKTLAKANNPDENEDSGSEEEKHSFDSDEDTEYRYKLKENVNRILRDQAAIDQEEYSEVIDARGLDEALNKLGAEIDKHPEKRARAAFNKYLEEQLVILKQENPTYKRSQLLEMIHKNWKKAPENPFNQPHLNFNEKK